MYIIYVDGIYIYIYVRIYDKLAIMISIIFILYLLRNIYDLKINSS